MNTENMPEIKHFKQGQENIPQSPSVKRKKQTHH